MKKFGMTVADLKTALEVLSDDTEVFIENSVNVLGNIGRLCEVRESTYGCFGKSLPCVIIGSEHNTVFEEESV